jgi:methyl-accepting chemotaxis protein
VARLVQEQYDEVLTGSDDIAHDLAPLALHLRGKTIASLTTLADIWVAQTVPLLARISHAVRLRAVGN